LLFNMFDRCTANVMSNCSLDIVCVMQANGPKDYFARQDGSFFVHINKHRQIPRDTDRGSQTTNTHAHKYTNTDTHSYKTYRKQKYTILFFARLNSNVG